MNYYKKIVDIPTKNDTDTKEENVEEKEETTSDQENKVTTYDEPQFPFEYDIEWLAITRAYNKYPLFESNPINIPSISEIKRLTIHN